MKYSAAVLVAVALAGCAGQRPSAPEAAAVIPPSAWHGVDGSSVGELTAAWWQTFGDATLTEVVERALDRNMDIAIAATRVEAARAQFSLARGQLLPSVELDAGAKRDRSLDAFGRPQLETAEEGDLGISYDLDLFGRLRHASESARASMLATQAARDNVMLAVASSAAAGYVGLRALDARLAVVRETVVARANSLEIVQRRAQTGYATRLELDQAEAELRGTEALVPPLELAITRQENGLSLLLGDNPRAIERGVALADFKRPAVPAMFPSEILRRRPDITEAEQRIIAADQSLDAARAAFMPSISLGIGGGYVNSTLIPEPAGVFALGGSILAPLYEGGRLRAQANAAAARRDEAAYQYRRVALNAFREVEDALAAVRHTTDQERVLREQRASLARTLVQATKRYRAGYSSYLEQLDAERGLLSADLSLVQAGSDCLTATIGLYQALGGGWSQDRFSDNAHNRAPSQSHIARAPSEWMGMQTKPASRHLLRV
jgi:NodT family efflux transporter outer membrane factor (OMF) lipoprotein